MNNLNQIARNFIEGEWIYNQKNNSLKKTFASFQELAHLNLINKEGYLDPKLKQEIIQLLGDKILKNIVGHFNDTDIFSGDILDDETFYNIELHNVSEDTLKELSKFPNVVIM